MRIGQWFFIGLSSDTGFVYMGLSCIGLSCMGISCMGHNDRGLCKITGFVYIGLSSDKGLFIWG